MKITFAFNYGVDCNKFHNNMVEESTSENPVNTSDWKICREILSEHFSDDESNQFYDAVDYCIEKGRPSLFLIASIVTND